MFKILRSFRTKITIVLIILMVFSGALGNFLVYDYSLKSQMEQLRDKLKIIAQAIALTVDAETLLKIPLNKEGEKAPEYKAIEQKLIKIKDLAPSIVYIYILAKTDKPNVLKFIIDVHSRSMPAKSASARPGEEYDVSNFPELPKGFLGASADRKLGGDKWGVFLSGYAPIRDKNENVVAMLGVDFSADDLSMMQKEAHKRAALVLLSGIILSFVLGMLISKPLTRPVEKLVEGTRNIASGNLKYRVNIKSPEELRELANSFNMMAFRLDNARKEMSDYFYRVAQSLVRVLEARDPYTKGHSDRVADYSIMIARELSLPRHKMETLKEAALLHDIGKMGIREIILEKKTELTPMDRDMIQRHPLIGESILTPVCLDQELLAAVRGHHEHYDGNGYPDKLKGDQINMLASIISVADAYDAMTTKRAYNVVLSKEAVLAELKKKSGTQFDPIVVNALIKVLG